MKERFRDINGEEYPEDAANWTAEDFIAYYSKKYGVMTLEEFDQFNKDIIKSICTGR